MSDRRQLVAVITADAKGLEAALAAAGRKGKRGAGKLGKDLGQQMRVSFKQGFGTATDLIGLGGVAGIMAAGKQVFDFQKRLVRLRQASRATGGQIQTLEQQIFRVAKARGIDPDQLLGGAEKYVERTGDLAGFSAAMDALGKVAMATGSELDDVAATQAALAQQFGLFPEETEKAFDVLASQGQRGTVEMKNLATMVANLAPTWRLFGDSNGVQGMADMGALLQMTAKGFGNATEAGTGFQSLMGNLIRATPKLNAIGVKTKGRSMADILFDLKGKNLSDVKVQNILGDKEAFKAYISIAEQGVGVYKDLRDQVAAAGTIEQGYKIWDDSPAKKMASAQAKLAEFFNESMAGHIESIAEALDHMADALSWATKHWKLLAAAWLVSKANGGNLLGTLSSLTGAAGQTSGAIAMIGKASLVAGSAVAGWEIGTYLSEKYGLGDAVYSGLEAIGGERDSNKQDLGKFLANTRYSTVGASIHRGMGGNDAVALRHKEIASGQGALPSVAKAATRATDQMLPRLLRGSGLTIEGIGQENLVRLQNLSDRKILQGANKYEEVGGSAKRVEAELAAEIRKLREAIKANGIAGIEVTTSDDRNSLNIRRKGQ